MSEPGTLPLRRQPVTRARRLRLLLVAVLAASAWLAAARQGHAQASALLSPGPLSKSHASLDGVANCAKCHEPGRKVTASRCLACHRPIAERIAARRGVHRHVTNECVQCHSEHNGRDAELRPFDAKRFDHAAETGFPLDGRHAPLSTACARCHTTRSFLQAKTACSSCHADPHRGALGSACATCHATSIAFADARRGFDHAKARFQLVGAHRTVECARCHVNKVFTGLKFARCTDCHQSPHRQVLGPDCTTCHGNDRWQTRKIDHGRTAFPLRGRHLEAACASCHRSPAAKVVLVFNRCAACHADVHRGQFKEDCGACHTENGFRSAPFDHGTRTRFALTGRHAGLACARCHVAAGAAAPAPGGPAGPGRAGGVRPAARAATERGVSFAGASPVCASCHADPHKGAANADCATCHTTADFRVAASAHRHDAKLAAFFAGSHGSAACSACHARATSPWRFSGTATACTTCHADAHQGQLGTACESCHAVDETGFAGRLFSHDKTGFPLKGRHRTAPCAECHRPATRSEDVKRVASAREPAVVTIARRPQAPAAAPQARTPLVFRGMGKDCTSCHADVHLGQLGPKCERCHGPDSFRVQSFAHGDKALAKFFSGTHATLACRACHKPEQARFPAATGTAVRYVGTGSRCASCHASDDEHRGALGSACETCHEPAAWKSASRAFHKAGLFPLDGRHLAVPCASCHVNGVTKGTPTTCYDCHWARRQDDRYHTRLGTQCEQCHRTTAWTAVNWNHAASTGFALNVAHQLLRCDNCHKDGRFTATSNNCVGCHQDAYARTTQPNHAAAGFPTNCEICHTASQTSWRGIAFDHRSFFPLVGVHASQPCASCHRNNAFAGTPTDCVGCHRADYQRTATPNHTAAGFPTTCESCHRASDGAWRGASFNHASFFPLVGLHATQACVACHKNNVYKGTGTECVACHQADYQRTANPNHAAAGIPTACVACHRPSDPNWGTGSFSHATFPLVGVHATQACATCHRNGVYTGTPRDCVGCHLADYQRAANPNHVSAGFPTTCDSCHRSADTSWRGATFNHASVFPLVGVHATQACAACHTNGIYKGTPRDCVGCHLADYQRTANPNHTAAGFPTTCVSCHRATDTSWQQGTFSHTWFPITSGRHSGLACSSCHTTPTNYAVFSCTNCHTRSQTDPRHGGVSGYRYDSAACYACHPTGRGD
jgi:hypothetical protein